jgi:hypothetical protein
MASWRSPPGTAPSAHGCSACSSTQWPRLGWSVPSGPPIFRFADEAEFARLLGDAGLGDVDVQTVAFTHRFASGDELWKGLMGGTVRTRALVLAQPKDVQAQIRAAFDRLVRPYATNGGVEMPVSVKLVSGRRAGRET